VDVNATDHKKSQLTSAQKISVSHDYMYIECSSVKSYDGTAVLHVGFSDNQELGSYSKVLLTVGNPTSRTIYKIQIPEEYKGTTQYLKLYVLFTGTSYCGQFNIQNLWFE